MGFVDDDDVPSRVKQPATRTGKGSEPLLSVCDEVDVDDVRSSFQLMTTVLTMDTGLTPYLHVRSLTDVDDVLESPHGVVTASATGSPGLEGSQKLGVPQLFVRPLVDQPRRAEHPR